MLHHEGASCASRLAAGEQRRVARLCLPSPQGPQESGPPDQHPRQRRRSRTRQDASVRPPLLSLRFAKNPLAMRLELGQSPAMTEGSSEFGTAPQPRVFATTRWSVVLAARDAHTPESSAALEKLCRAYWYPLYAHIRRRGYSEAEAQDLTQELFKRLLERQFLSGLLREGGRFRSFLLTALDHFLTEHWQRSRAQKRGGGHSRCFLTRSADPSMTAMSL
jgi:hypothetical protein